jgi:peptidoglycan/xylan/chitin deacetylase (PgdA/CDA1 family)
LSLARLLAAVDPLDLPVPGGRPAGVEPEWFLADGWRVLAHRLERPAFASEISRFQLPDGRTVAATFDPATGEVGLPFDPDEAYTTLVSERWRQHEKSRELGAANLARYYRFKHLIPRGLQLRARRVLARWQGIPEFPVWPLDRSVVELLRLYVLCGLHGSGRTSLPFRWFWPGGKAAALMLTHDVESSEGLRKALELAAIEEDRGFRSSFNVVASSYPVDMGIVAELQARGFEIGVHGVHHDRSMFSSRDQFEAQQPAVREAADRFGAVGFRSPATHRVFEWLGALPVLYDCSIPHSDPYEPQPGGCCTVWPFFIGDVVELPYTLPQDHTLFTVLGHRSAEVWLRQIEELVALNGLIQIVSHPDPGYLGDPEKRRLYAETLDVVSERDDLWSALPRDVAAWWLQRDCGNEEPFVATIGDARLVGGSVEFVARA